MTFDEFYRSYYQQRWDALVKAMKMDSSENIKIPRVTKRTNLFDHFEKLLPEIPEFGDCLAPQDIDSEDIYYLDFASVVAARSLACRAGDKVLDMCAAPGGKSLVLAYDMSFRGQLECNEPSRARRERLKKVLRTYLETQKNTELEIKVRGVDGLRFGLDQAGLYDKVLVDAPCSGERHLLSRPEELKKWSPKRSKRLAQRQYGLLCSALLALKPGGVLIYSTCSLSELENDGNIEKLLKKKGDQFELGNDHVWQRWRGLKGMEKTKYGLQFMPDHSKGMGPLYFTRIIKSITS